MPKIKAEITIAIGSYENIKPVIEIDTDNIGAAKNDLLKLWDAFHNIVQYRPTKSAENHVDFMEETSMPEEESIEDKLARDVRDGKTILFEDWDKLTPSQKQFLHKQQLLFAAEQRATNKNANTKELGSTESPKEQ